MTKETYNGWTNYPTWRINLEIFDGMSLKDMGLNECEDDFLLSKELREFALDIVCPEADGSLKTSYAYAFMSDVNWYEIAQSMIENAKKEV